MKMLSKHVFNALPVGATLPDNVLQKEKNEAGQWVLKGDVNHPEGLVIAPGEFHEVFKPGDPIKINNEILVKVASVGKGKAVLQYPTKNAKGERIKLHFVPGKKIVLDVQGFRLTGVFASTKNRRIAFDITDTPSRQKKTLGHQNKTRLGN